ncbi:MAG: AAA family ATPase [Alphaproteobacteria bacterium]|nr:AAA family ATPase [Alphaproteobacteria bacterium]
MAIYHLHSGFVSRSSGRTAVQSAAYICGEKLHEDYRDQSVDFTKRAHDVVSYKTIVPDNCKYQGLNIWNEVENFENRYADSFFKNEAAREKFKESAQTAQTFVVALPNELGGKVGEELVEKFVQTRFTSRNLVATYAIHKAPDNWHAHIQVSRRAIAENGDFALRKDREICTKSALMETRKLWADLANEFLAREGFKERITEKSFEALGIDLEASKHRGWYADVIGTDSRIVQENLEIAKQNEERILANPNIVLDYLNEKQAVFMQKDILKEIGKRVFEPQRASAVFEKVLDSAVFVGESVNGQFLYTSEKYQQMESEVFSKLDELTARTGDFGAKGVEQLVASKYGYLNNEQQTAVRDLCNERSFSVLVGKAGAGKTTTMKAVAEAYAHSGRRVVGMSLSAVAAENLGKDAGIESATIASWTHRWREYEAAKEKFLSFDSVVTDGVLKQFDWYNTLKQYEGSQLKSGDVIVVDEAGMVGAKDWSEIFAAAQNFDVKVIAIGDDNQFKPISAGDCFKKFAEQEQERGQLLELNEIRRQKYDWQRDASVEFSQLNTAEGLAHYEQKGCLHEIQKPQDIASKFIEIEGRGSAAVLCFSNKECEAINDAVRAFKKENGTLGADLVQINGRNFAVGDRLIFLENSKQFDVKNGQVGQVTDFKDGVLSVKTEEGNRDIPVSEYTKVNHAYAITLYKAQGKTYDNTIVVASKFMDAKAAYVGMTRHRENVDLYYCKEDFASFKELTASLSRYSHKDSVVDFREGFENQNKVRVSEYQSLQQEIASVLRDINRGEADWKEYHTLKNQFAELGREILGKFSEHKLYVEQIGLTREKIEIAIGLKQRPLCRAELQAKETVELYVKAAQDARALCTSMKRDKFNITEHSSYATYCEIRQARNDLAREILANYPLHREFVNAKAKEFFISKKTMEKQIEYESNVLRQNEKGRDTFITKAERSAFISKVEQYQNPQRKSNLIEQMTSAGVIANAEKIGEGTLYAMNRDAYKEKYGFGLHVSSKMVRDYTRFNHLNIENHMGIAEYASMLAEKQLNRGDRNFNSEITERCIKQALCFEVLKKFCEAGTLSRESIVELNQKAHTLAEHLNDKNIQILNEHALMKEAFEKLATLPEQSISERGKSAEHNQVSLSQSEIQRIMTNERSVKMLEMGVQQQAKFRDTELQI